MAEIYPKMVKSKDAALVGVLFADMEYWRGRAVMRDLIRTMVCSCEYRNGKKKLKLDEMCNNCLVIHKLE